MNKQFFGPRKRHQNLIFGNYKLRNLQNKPHRRQNLLVHLQSILLNEKVIFFFLKIRYVVTENGYGNIDSLFSSFMDGEMHDNSKE